MAFKDKEKFDTFVTLEKNKNLAYGKRIKENYNRDQSCTHSTYRSIIQE